MGPDRSWITDRYPSWGRRLPMTQLCGWRVLDMGLLDLGLLHNDLLMLVLVHDAWLHHRVMVVDRVLGDHIDRGGVMAHGYRLAGAE